MFFGHSEVIHSLYGMKPVPQQDYSEKLKAAKEYLGDKYVLAKPVERKDA